MYFLENCPGVKMDGEGDGIPAKGSGVAAAEGECTIGP